MRIIRNENDLADLAKRCRIVWRQFIQANGGPYGQSQLDVLADRIPNANRADIQAALELIDRRDRERDAQRQEIERAQQAQELDEQRQIQLRILAAQNRSEGYAEGRRDTQRLFGLLLGFVAVILLVRHC